MTIIDIAYHRNGIGGAPFRVILFEDDSGRKVGIVFEEAYHCAVFDVAKLASGDIAFASNSWRGDQFEPVLRRAIRESQSTNSQESL